MLYSASQPVEGKDLLPFGACGFRGVLPLKARHNPANVFTQQPSIGKKHSKRQLNQHEAWLSSKISTSAFQKNKSLSSL